MRSIFLMLLPLFAYAGEGATDIFPRTVNFVIFAIILYYIAAKHVKKLLADRKYKFEQRLANIESQLIAAQQTKQEAAKKIKEAEQQAKEMVLAAKSQAKSAVDAIEVAQKQEMEYLEKQFSEQLEYESNEAKKAVIAEFLDELIATRVNFSQDELLEIAKKKAS